MIGDNELRCRWIERMARHEMVWWALAGMAAGAAIAAALVALF